MMNSLLLLILFILMIIIAGKKGIKLFISLILNFVVLMIIFALIAIGINPIVISLIGCLLISLIVLYFVNGKNIKTESSFVSIIIVLIILAFFIYGISYLCRIGGFGYESFEEINMFSYNININFVDIEIALILIGLIGATIDSSIAISSALYEVYCNNKHLSTLELFRSGLTIGKDILGTTTNTLLFAFLGEFMTLLIWFRSGTYSFGEIFNNKSFTAEFVKILFSGIGCILVIPITAIITSYRIKHPKEEYYLD